MVAYELINARSGKVRLLNPTTLGKWRMDKATKLANAKALRANVDAQIATLPSNIFVGRILGVISLATPEEYADGMAWYEVQGNAIAAHGAEFGYTRSQSCGIFAALSPQQAVPANWKMFRQFCDNPFSKPKAATENMHAKCTEISNNAAPLLVLGGAKTTNFYINLSQWKAGGNHAVTIDRHAASAVYDVMISKVEDRWYEHATLAFLSAAYAIGITGFQAQAIAWIVWRRLKGLPA